MSSPSPFEIGRTVGNNIGNSLTKMRDNSAIESILAEAMSTGDPQVLQNSIGKILSQVSPERQGVAVQYLQNAYTNVQKKQEQVRAEEKGRMAAQKGGYTYGAPSQVQAQELRNKAQSQAQNFKTEEQKKLEKKEKDAAKEAGYTYGSPAQVAAQQLKDKAKNQRLSQYGLGTNQNSSPNLSNAENVTGLQDNQGTNQTSPSNSTGSVFKKFSDDQLVTLTGAPDREVSEPAKAELKRRDEERNLKQKEKEGWTKFGMERAKKVLDKSEEIAQSLPVKKTALKMMTDSISNKNLGFWTLDNLAEITGIEAFRSPEGALFKTAGKEYFLGNISRAGARPNQWIEQQIADMMTKIGRTTEANLSVARALQNETDLDEERVRLTDETFNDLRKEGKDIGDLGSIVNSKLSKFAEQKQNELFNDLRAIKAIGENKPQKFHKVAQGTQISPYMVDALLDMFNNDEDKSLQAAKKLGYFIE